jgi:hypothetical protein
MESDAHIPDIDFDVEGHLSSVQPPEIIDTAELSNKGQDESDTYTAELLNISVDESSVNITSSVPILLSTPFNLLDHTATADQIPSVAAPIIRKVKKPRKKLEKPIIKLNSLFDGANVQLLEGRSDASELFGVGIKKKAALESLRQAQGLFRFIPSSSSNESSNTWKNRGPKIANPLPAYSSTTQTASSSIESLVSDNCESTASNSSSDIQIDFSKPDSLQVDQILIMDVNSSHPDLGVAAALEKESAFEKIIPDLGEESAFPQEEKEKEKISKLKVKAKPRVKDEMKRQTSKISSQNVDGDIRLPIESLDANTIISTSHSIEKPLGSDVEKIKGKRKYVFQQPSLKMGASSSSSKGKGANLDDSLRGSYFDKDQQEVSLFADSSETTSLKEVPATNQVDEEEDSQRDMEENDTSGGSGAAKAAKGEKIIRRVKGDPKECSMMEVPGGHLLGPKMLAFMKAFPEGDVLGNDDVETVSTQRLRMEGWLKTVRNGSSNGIATNDLEREHRAVKKVQTHRSDSTEYSNMNFMNVKTELLDSIEEKLSKAATATGRSTGNSSLLYKPGIIQILLPYEVIHSFICIATRMFFEFSFLTFEILFLG